MCVYVCVCVCVCVGGRGNPSLPKKIIRRPRYGTYNTESKLSIFICESILWVTSLAYAHKPISTRYDMYVKEKASTKRYKILLTS